MKRIVIRMKRIVKTWVTLAGREVEMWSTAAPFPPLVHTQQPTRTSALTHVRARAHTHARTHTHGRTHIPLQEHF